MIQEEKRINKKFKRKERRKFPYKSRIPINVNQTEKYIVLDEEGKEIGRYRLKTTAMQIHKKRYKIVVKEEEKKFINKPLFII